MKFITVITTAIALLAGSALAAPKVTDGSKRQADICFCLSPDSCYDTCGSRICCIGKEKE
ncbi:hypothetical protein CC79DRAFT_1370638 [Sarocladium strictum]